MKPSLATICRRLYAPPLSRKALSRSGHAFVSKRKPAKLRRRFALGYARPVKLALYSATEARGLNASTECRQLAPPVYLSATARRRGDRVGPTSAIGTGLPARRVSEGKRTLPQTHAIGTVFSHCLGITSHGRSHGNRYRPTRALEWVHEKIFFICTRASYDGHRKCFGSDLSDADEHHY